MVSVVSDYFVKFLEGLDWLVVLGDLRVLALHSWNNGRGTLLPLGFWCWIKQGGGQWMIFYLPSSHPTPPPAPRDGYEVLRTCNGHFLPLCDIQDVSSVLAKRLAGKYISKMTYFVSSGT